METTTYLPPDVFPAVRALTLLLPPLFACRITLNGMKVSRPDVRIGRFRMIKHERDKHNEPNPQRYRSSAPSGHRRHRFRGLFFFFFFHQIFLLCCVLHELWLHSAAGRALSITYIISASCRELWWNMRGTGGSLVWFISHPHGFKYPGVWG